MLLTQVYSSPVMIVLSKTVVSSSHERQRKKWFGLVGFGFGGGGGVFWLVGFVLPFFFCRKGFCIGISTLFLPISQIQICPGITSMIHNTLGGSGLRSPLQTQRKQSQSISQVLTHKHCPCPFMLGVPQAVQKPSLNSPAQPQKKKAQQCCKH